MSFVCHGTRLLVAWVTTRPIGLAAKACQFVAINPKFIENGWLARPRTEVNGKRSSQKILLKEQCLCNNRQQRNKKGE